MPDFSLEQQHTGIIAGVDEVGRGPLAGCVVAAAVILDPTLPVALKVRDSKKISHAKRVAIAAELHSTAIVSIAEASVFEIDSLNILQASLLAMQRAVAGLAIRPDVALIDGNKAPILPCKAVTVVKGDDKSCSIAAASIVAKVYRDALMQELHEMHPHYGWADNAGYPTAHHRAALQEYGITEHHRRSFAPVKNLLTISLDR
jgi:ribonuclease HII